MKAETECRIVVADNGRMWIDGELDGILDVRNRLSEISRVREEVETDGRVWRCPDDR